MGSNEHWAALHFRQLELGDYSNMFVEVRVQWHRTQRAYLVYDQPQQACRHREVLKHHRRGQGQSDRDFARRLWHQRQNTPGKLSRNVREWLSMDLLCRLSVKLWFGASLSGWGGHILGVCKVITQICTEELLLSLKLRLFSLRMTQFLSSVTFS